MTFPEQLQAAVADWVSSGGDEQKEATVHALLDTPEYRSLSYLIRNRPFLTSSKLKAFKECPYHARLKYVDEVDMGFEAEDYFVIGQAVDDYLTHGPDHFAGKYEVVARRSKDAEKVQLTNATFATVDNAVKEYGSRDIFPKQPAKRNVLWLMGGVPCKAELDHFDPVARRIGDIKTCASITTFDPDNYKLQMGFYAFGIEKRFGEAVEAELYVVDKHSDWSRSHKWVYSRPTLQSRYYEIETLVQQWRDSVETGIWPHIDPNSERGLKTCWASEFWPVCPFCKTAPATVL